MVAPVDAKTVLTVGEGQDEESFTLAMNMRTLALAKAGGVNMLNMKGTEEIDAFGLAVIVRAFATPAHPNMTEDEAGAIILRHGEEAGQAIRELGESFSAQIGKGKGGNPLKTRQTKKG